MTSTAYLEWVKQLDADIVHGQSVLNLAGSSIKEPTHILVNDLSPIDQHLNQSNPWGLPRLLAAIANRYHTQPERVLLTSGASLAGYLVMRALLKPGEHAIVEQPAYQPLLSAVLATGATVSRLHRRAENQYEIDLDDLKGLLTPETRLVILTNLHAPTGAFTPIETLQQIAILVRDQSPEARIVVDEIFHDFARTIQPPAALIDEAFISINSLSKVYGLSLLRCGWILAAPEAIQRIRHQYILVENIGSPLLESVAARVLESSDVYDNYWQTLLAHNRSAIAPIVTSLIADGYLEGALPEAGCTYFPRLTRIADSTSFVEHLATLARVLVVPGYFFGAPAHIRIGFGGASDGVAEGFYRLDDALRQWSSSTNKG